MSSIKTTQIDGDVSIGRNVAIGGNADIAGNATVGHNLKVEGWLEAPNISGVIKGVFRSFEDLVAAYPEPSDGWLAGVGSSTPFDSYIGEGGEWVATGGSIEVTIGALATIDEAKTTALDEIEDAKDAAIEAIGEMAEGLDNKDISPTTTTVANRVYQGSQNGVVGGTFSYTVVSSGVTYYQSQKFDVVAGKTYNLSYVQNSLCNGWFFLDEDDKIISMSDVVTAKTNINVDVVAPEGAVTLIITRYKQSSDADAVVTQIGKLDQIESEMSGLELRLGVEEQNHCYMDKLGVLDNFLMKEGRSLQSVNDITSKPIGCPTVWYNGNIIGVSVYQGVRYQLSISKAFYAVLKIKKSGIAGRRYVLTTQNFTPGSDISTHITFAENVEAGTLLTYQNAQYWGKILKVSDDYIWLYLPSHVHVISTDTDNTNLQSWGLYACDSYTSKSVYTLGTLELDYDGSFILEGDKSITWDIMSNLNIFRKYYTRPEKIGSQLVGKNVLVFSDSLSYFIYGLVYDWGVNVYNNAWGGARMGYEGGGGQGGESETYENAWLCRDSYVQYVKNNVIAAGINIDYIVCTAGVNGTLPDTDETEVAYVLNNKRWYHDDLESDPWASLSSDNKARFNSTACTYAAFYSLCVAYPKAIPVIVAPYRSPGAGITVIDETHPWTAERFAHALFYENLLPKRNALKGIADNLGGVFVDCYTATRSSIANCPQYYAESGVHPTRIVAQDMANQIGRALNCNHGIVAESVTYN